MTYKNFCNTIDRFLKLPLIEKMRLAFRYYDKNGDGLICQNDMFLSLTSLKKYDYHLTQDVVLLCQ